MPGDPSLVEVLGGEPGLLEHILVFLVQENSSLTDRVIAGTSAVRWLQVCTQTNRLVRPALWVTLLSTYYPNYPMPRIGFIAVHALFREMWHRYKEYAKAKDLYDRLCVQYDNALIEMAAAWATRTFTQKRRAKWELEQSKLAAKSDMEWRASFLKKWDGDLKSPPPPRPEFSEVADGDYALERARAQAYAAAAERRAWKPQ